MRGWLANHHDVSIHGHFPDRRYLTFISEDPSLSKELIAKKLSRGWCFGSPEFRDQMRRESRRLGREIGRQRFVGLDREFLREERERVWEMKLQGLARVAKIDLLTLPPKKSAREKLLLGAALKQTTSVNNGWLARRLDLGHETSVGPFLTRWRRAPAGTRAPNTVYLVSGPDEFAPCFGNLRTTGLVPFVWPPPTHASDFSAIAGPYDTRHLFTPIGRRCP